MDIEPVSISPNDIKVSLERDLSTPNRQIFLINSISRKSGEYQVKFKSNCGEKFP
jgi:hypothetical protein